MRRKEIKDNLKDLFPEIAKEWHPTKNGDLLPSEVSAYSSQKVWWLHPYDDPKTGKHFDFEWVMPIDNRTTQGCNCPYLSGKLVWKGFNDLESVFPEIAKEWHPSKNGDLKPSQITYGNGRRVWWLYPYDDPKTGKHFDFEWECSVNNRTSQNSKCPYIYGRGIWKGFNDLETTNPDLAKEFHPQKNGDLTVNNVAEKNSKKVWWLCVKGHEWQAPISVRAKGIGCPYCAGVRIWPGDNDLLTKYPEICKEWDYEKNKIKPNEIGAGSGKKVWWICSKNHHFQSSPNSRVLGIGCPFCSGRNAIENENDLATINPQLASEWNYEKNGELTPSMVKEHSSISVWWRCEFGHEWKTSVSNRTYGKGCPFCSSSGTSLVEQGVAFYVSKVYKIEQRRKVNGCEVDIFLQDYSIGIEYDGQFYHSSESSRKREERKDKILKNNNILLVRIKETKDRNEVEGNIIYYKADYFGENYVQMIKTVLHLLSLITGKDDKCDIDIRRDITTIRERIKLLNEENSLETIFPEIAKEWHPTKNGLLKPNMVAYGSMQMIWWKCKNGHEWQTRINTRTRPKATGCPYCSGRQAIQGENDFATLYPSLLKEWDYKKNKSNPSKITAKSCRNYWWVCSKGHSYRASTYNRINGTNCPICLNHTVLEGYNDLKTVFPEIAKEWDSKKNGGLEPSKVLSGSHDKAWWICPKGHSYNTKIESRTRNKTGCPICSGKKILYGFNDLQSQRPDVAKEWNYEKNGELIPTEVNLYSNKRVWWKCYLGHEWQTSVSHRITYNNGCPYCAGQRTIIGKNDLLSVNPKLAAEWNYEKNGELKPFMVMPKSGKRVWWRCTECQYEWNSTVANRTVKRSGCPNCKHKWSES